MTTIKKITNHEYAQCFVEIKDNKDIFFFSYQTLVAEIEKDTNGERWLKINGLYSMTTRKQLGWFLREYCNLSYQTAKSLYEDGYKLNLDTGEVVEI